MALPSPQCTVTAFYSEEDREAGTSGIAEVPSETSSVDLHTYTFDVMVKYVRREIRDLTDRDRETFFNAVSVLQRVPSAVGRQIYGEKYYSKDYFNRIHLYYGELAMYAFVGGLPYCLARSPFVS